MAELDSWPKDLPAHLTDYQLGTTANFTYQLCRWANKMCWLIGEPIYLCGSRLDPARHARDWDIRICLPDNVFALRYGGFTKTEETIEQWVCNLKSGMMTPRMEKWSADCVHFSREATRHVGEPVDVQLIPETYWQEFKDKPRVRIDTRSY